MHFQLLPYTGNADLDWWMREGLPTEGSLVIPVRQRLYNIGFVIHLLQIHWSISNINAQYLGVIAAAAIHRNAGLRTFIIECNATFSNNLLRMLLANIVGITITSHTFSLYDLQVHETSTLPFLVWLNLYSTVVLHDLSMSLVIRQKDWQSVHLKKLGSMAYHFRGRECRYGG